MESFRKCGSHFVGTAGHSNCRREPVRPSPQKKNDQGYCGFATCSPLVRSAMVSESYPKRKLQSTSAAYFPRVRMGMTCLLVEASSSTGFLNLVGIMCCCDMLLQHQVSPAGRAEEGDGGRLPPHQKSVYVGMVWGPWGVSFLACSGHSACGKRFHSSIL